MSNLGISAKWKNFVRKCCSLYMLHYCIILGLNLKITCFRQNGPTNLIASNSSSLRSSFNFKKANGSLTITFCFFSFLTYSDKRLRRCIYFCFVLLSLDHHKYFNKICRHFRKYDQSFK